MNLISNSVKFTDSGSVNIKVDWIPGEMIVRDEHYNFEEFDKRCRECEPDYVPSENEFDVHPICKMKRGSNLQIQ